MNISVSVQKYITKDNINVNITKETNWMQTYYFGDQMDPTHGECCCEHNEHKMSFLATGWLYKI